MFCFCFCSSSLKVEEPAPSRAVVVVEPCQFVHLVDLRTCWPRIFVLVPDDVFATPTVYGCGKPYPPPLRKGFLERIAEPSRFPLFDVYVPVHRELVLQDFLSRIVVLERLDIVYFPVRVHPTVSFHCA